MLGRLVAVVFYAALAVMLLSFIFSNRHVVELSLFPLGVVADMPLYFALALVFVIGLLLGLSYSAFLALRYRRREFRHARLIAQLEKELDEKSEASKLASA